MEWQFPKGFLWGAATSAHQVEGGNTNDWSEWEKKNAQRLAKEARHRWQDWQKERFPEMFDPDNYVSGAACDHYNRYEEDLDLAAELGLNAYRFSVEWSRIEPERGKFDEAQIEHYRRVIQALRKRNIEPFVTLWHWTNPLWIRDIGGWGNPETIEHFTAYVGRIVGELGDAVTFWMPLNEPSTYIGLGYAEGVFPPQKKSVLAAGRALRNMVEAHRRAYSIIHDTWSNAVVVASHYAVFMTAYKHLPWNRVLVVLLDYIRNKRLLNALRECTDAIGIQYYHRDRVALSVGGAQFGLIDIRNENSWVTDMGWEVYPEGIYHLLKMASRYGKPVYITENGTADAWDERRGEFIREHLRWVYKAVEEGVDVRGYFYWSLLDNFEWDKGFWPRFGLIEVDYRTQKRSVRHSAYEYADIIKANR